MKVAVFGATGQVGYLMRSILSERRFPADSVKFFATKNSEGKILDFNGEKVKVQDVESRDFKNIDIALFSMGSDAAKIWAPEVARMGATVIDNSKAFRMDPDVPLIVAEVNPQEVKNARKNIIANPNCTTMVAMPVLAPLHRLWGLKQLIASTYQAASGAGRDGILELKTQANFLVNHIDELTFNSDNLELPKPDVFPEEVAFNVIPIAGTLEDDETSEEKKLRDESRKILEIPDLSVSATCVRVGVACGHSLDIRASFDKPIDVDVAADTLKQSKGVVVNDIPTPIKSAGKDLVMVGRIRIDRALFNTLDLFVCGDNLRKGAALNAVQIAELLIS
jgi:aspartate-semialdehyde dehydrogenase